MCSTSILLLPAQRSWQSSALHRAAAVSVAVLGESGTHGGTSGGGMFLGVDTAFPSA